MSSRTYAGANGEARRVKHIYVGVNGVARLVKRIYAGVNGAARLVYQGVGTVVSIPTMTSAAAPSGMVGVTSYRDNNSTYAGWHAFDKDSSTRWESKNYNQDNTRAVFYDFGYKIQPTSVYIKNFASNGNAYGFVIEASADMAFTTCDVLVDCSANSAAVDQTYTITTRQEYRYYRYRCTNGASTYRAGVYEMDVTGLRYD